MRVPRPQQMTLSAFCWCYNLNIHTFYHFTLEFLKSVQNWLRMLKIINFPGKKFTCRPIIKNYARHNKNRIFGPKSKSASRNSTHLGPVTTTGLDASFVKTQLAAELIGVATHSLSLASKASSASWSSLTTSAWEFLAAHLSGVQAKLSLASTAPLALMNIYLRQIFETNSSNWKGAIAVLNTRKKTDKKTGFSAGEL